MYFAVLAGTGEIQALAGRIADLAESCLGLVHV